MSPLDLPGKRGLTDVMPHQNRALRYRGAIDGIGSDPRFVVADTDGRVVDQALAARPGRPGGHEGVLPVLHEWIAGHTDHLRVAAVGHRVVYGGEQFAAPVLVDDALLDQLKKLAPLAPLHQPHNLMIARHTLARTRR